MRENPGPEVAVIAFAILALGIGGRIAPAAPADGAKLWPARGVLQFPEDRSMGTLYTQPLGPMTEEAWHPLQEARGAVTVPDGAFPA